MKENTRGHKRDKGQGREDIREHKWAEGNEREGGGVDVPLFSVMTGVKQSSGFLLS